MVRVKQCCSQRRRGGHLMLAGAGFALAARQANARLMSMAGILARRSGFLVRFRRYHDQAAISNAALRDDVVGEMLDFGPGPLQGRHLHAIVVVEVNVKRGHREIMMAVIVLDQAPR